MRLKTVKISNFTSKQFYNQNIRKMKNLLYDLFNGITLYDLSLFFLQLFSALILGQLIKFTVKNSSLSISLPSIVYLILPVMLAFLVIISKNSAPLSISLLGVFILTGSFFKDTGNSEKIILFILAGAGFGCASGFVLVTIIFYALIVLPAIYFSARIK